MSSLRCRFLLLGSEDGVLWLWNSSSMHWRPLPGYLDLQSALRLADFAALAQHHTEDMLSSREKALEWFLSESRVIALGRPDDVVEQWIFDHAEHFERDYGHIDLKQIRWSQIELPTNEIIDLPTGPSDAGALEQYSENPDYWLDLRSESIQQSWRAGGTWMRPPLLIDRSAIDPELLGLLQVLEGRCRVGQLRGRNREGLFVAAKHQVWLGERRSP